MAYTGSYQRGDILSDSPQSKGWEIAWKIYFFALIAILLLFVTHVPEVFVDLSPQVIAWIAVTLFTIIGAFGFAWRERIFGASFWKGFFVIAVLFMIALFFIPITTGVKDAVAKNMRHTIGAIITYVIFVLPALAAIFLYAFRSKELWNVVVEADEKGKAKKR